MRSMCGVVANGWPAEPSSSQRRSSSSTKTMLGGPLAASRLSSKSRRGSSAMSLRIKPLELLDQRCPLEPEHLRGLVLVPLRELQRAQDQVALVALHEVLEIDARIGFRRPNVAPRKSAGRDRPAQ